MSKAYCSHIDRNIKFLTHILTYALIVIYAFHPAIATAQVPVPTPPGPIVVSHPHDSLHAEINPADSSSKEKDIVDVVRKLFHINEASVPDSLKIRPGKVFYAILPGVGYSIVTSLTVVSTFDLSFYLGKKGTTNLSTVTFVPEYSISHKQLILPLVFNIWPKKNSYNILGDWRYYKFPSYTFGLGSDTKLANGQLVDYSYLRIYQEVLKQFFIPDFYLGVGYGLDYHWNINPHIANGPNDFNTYNNGATQTISSGPLIHILYDSRRNINYPEGGFVASVTFRPNFTFMGSDQNWQSLIVDIRKYIKVSKKSHNVLALWSYNWFTLSGNPPYLDLPCTGGDTYASTGRGYVQGRYRGDNMLYAEAEYRFEITRNGLLGGVVFVNAESVSGTGNASWAFNRVCPAAGPGLRVKMNKYSKANLAIDYGFGVDGSHGLQFNLTEMF